MRSAILAALVESAGVLLIAAVGVALLLGWFR